MDSLHAIRDAADAAPPFGMRSRPSTRRMIDEETGARDDVFPVLSLADCFAAQQRSARWTIKGWLPEAGLVALFGPSNAFKSFAAIDMALCVAHGMDWHGHATAQAPVLYLALEGSDGVIRQRVPGWHRHHGLEDADPPFRVIEVPVILSRLPDAEKLERTAKAAFGRPPGLIVVDVLKRTMDGTDSSDEDVAKLLDACRRVFSPAVILFITHSGWGDGSRIRGSSDLWGSFDTRLMAAGDKESRRVTITVERHKDADSGAAISFDLVTVETGMADDEGAPVTTLVPELAEDQRPAKRPTKMTPAQKLGLDILRDCVIRDGVPPPSHVGYPRGVTGVTVDQWRAELRSRGALNSEGNHREEFRRLKTALLEKKIVAIRENFLWIV